MTQVSIGIFRLISAAFRAVVLSNTMAFSYVGGAMLFNGFIIQLQDVSPAAFSFIRAWAALSHWADRTCRRLIC